jgi:hypothetical protein
MTVINIIYCSRSFHKCYALYVMFYWLSYNRPIILSRYVALFENIFVDAEFAPNGVIIYKKHDFVFQRQVVYQIIRKYRIAVF